MSYIYVVEHLDPDLGAWSALEYKSIAQELSDVGAEFMLTSVPDSVQLPPNLRSVQNIKIEPRNVEEIFGSQKEKICLLDPAATVELSPADGDKFQIFLFGGILGDNPPRVPFPRYQPTKDRTSELRQKGYFTRRLGPKQMTTDTAVRVTSIVVQNKGRAIKLPSLVLESGLWELDPVNIPLLYFSHNAIAKSAADYYVHSLPGQPDGPLLKMHAGHIEVDHAHNANLFFWHFQNRHIANRQRTVIWLNGGPGCSSMDGALMEIGPYRLKNDQNLTYNEGSWDEFSNLLFVDQPAGTGFSYVNGDSYIHELDEMAEQFVIFLEKWFALFPHFEGDDIYLAGESYAGQYIPYIAQYILRHNNKNSMKQNKRAWNLRGLLIGNGWISPVHQYPAYLSFAYKENLLQKGSQAAQRVQVEHSKCLAKLSEAGSLNKIHITDCEQVLQQILEESRKDGKCLNMYDIRLRDTFPSCGMKWPPDLSTIAPYLRRKDVMSALNINKDKVTGWSECSGAVGENFHARNSKPSVQLIPGLLEAGIPIVLFSGDRDLICNHAGTEELINGLSWSGGTGFELSPDLWAPRHDWTFEGKPAGIYQQARNLTYVEFYNASHMVPYDHPRRSRDMLDRFLAVDITNIGGHPADSRIDGLKGNPTSVGGHPNSTTAEEQEKEKLKHAAWQAYYKSGEIALVVVIFASAIWALLIWKSRKRELGMHKGLYANIVNPSSASVSNTRDRGQEASDIESGRPFLSESELDTLSFNESPGPSVLPTTQQSYSVANRSDNKEF
ncbi:Cell death protease [Myotisia sp. PD_48]|nr:Cell death protease [Myotisia sp. PD_48]